MASEEVLRAVDDINNSPDKVRDNSVETSAPEEDKEALNMATKVRDLILKQDVTFGINESKVAYARIKINNHYEVYPIESRSFRDIVIEITENSFNGRVVAKAVIDSALESIGSKARRMAYTPEIAPRVKYLPEEEKIYLDLCNKEWEVVEIDRKGWRVIDNSPIWFYRDDDNEALPLPILDDKHIKENLDRLKKYINYDSDDDFDLMLAWLLSNFLTGVSVPVLVLQGSAGAGKTNTSKMLRSVVDPAKKMGVISRVKPRPEDIILDVAKYRVLAYDNLSSGTISAEISDLLASIATRAATQKRALYTDLGVIAVELEGCLLFNGIDDLVKRGDLLDRSVLINLPELKTRKKESDLKAGFKREHPYILGALLSACSMALRNNGQSSFNKSRLTDWGQFVENASIALKWNAKHFEEIYLGNRETAKDTLVENNYFILGIIELVDNYGGNVSYYATPLIDEIKSLEFVTDSINKNAIPQPLHIKQRLKRDEDLLKSRGIVWDVKLKDGKSLYTFTRKN